MRPVFLISLKGWIIIKLLIQRGSHFLVGFHYIKLLVFISVRSEFEMNYEFEFLAFLANAIIRQYKWFSLISSINYYLKTIFRVPKRNSQTSQNQPIKMRNYGRIRSNKSIINNVKIINGIIQTILLLGGML